MPKKKNDNLKIYSFLIINENTVLPFESLTQEQRNKYIPKIMKNVGRAGSDYLNCHPGEASDYLERKRIAEKKLANTLKELERHLKCTEELIETESDIDITFYAMDDYENETNSMDIK